MSTLPSPLVARRVAVPTAGGFACSCSRAPARGRGRAALAGRRTDRGRAQAAAAEARAEKREPHLASSDLVFKGKPAAETTVAVLGSTGYIGKYVTRELVARGYDVVAVARSKSGIGGAASEEKTRADFPGASVVFGDAADVDSLDKALESHGKPIDAVVCCLASRTGGVEDSWLVDYQATRNGMDVGLKRGMSHYVLLSAICVQKPTLVFQQAKLKFEAELAEAAEKSDGKLTYSLVRPTAFFKSLAGQVESVRSGGPYVMFGDGELCACKPISERDLAAFISNAVDDETYHNKVLPIGGPGEALTPKQQGTMLFEKLGIEKPFFVTPPIEIMDVVIKGLDAVSGWFPGNKGLEDAAEFGKIGRYYAAESMLVMDETTGEYDADATPSFGNDTLEAFFEAAAKDPEVLKAQALGDQAVFGVGRGEEA